MGDILSLVEKAQQQFSQEETAKLEKRMASGKFSLDDFLLQLRKMKSMGSMKDLIKKIPGMGGAMPDDMDIDDGELGKIEAAILSMTPEERANPRIIDSSRRRRIAKGAGVDREDVSGLVKQFEPMKKMMGQMAGKSFLQRMKMGTQFSQMAMQGGMPKIKAGTRSRKRVLSKKDRRRRRK